MKARQVGGFAETDHDHESCVADALDAASALCRRRGARLTELRRRVLELVWGDHEPVGAYTLLAALSGEGRGVAPPTVYRALEFLSGHGLIHRIESFNAYIGCIDPRRPHAGQFLLCERCGVAVELDDPRIGGAIASSAEGIGFRVHRMTVEVRGTCPHCLGVEAQGGG